MNEAFELLERAPAVPETDRRTAILEAEEEACFRFFWETASQSPKTYGLIPDNDVNPDMCSVASVGFGLAALPVGVHRGWISYGAGEERALGTLLTLNTKIEAVHGFYRHFLHMKTGERWGKSEISIIDTGLLVMGALCAGVYFGGRVREEAEKLAAAVDWDWYRNPATNTFYMGCDDGAHPGAHFGAWDMYAEQLLLYVLACGSPTHPLPAGIYYDCPMRQGGYGGAEGIWHSPGGALFVYQFSHAFIDFSGRRDKRGIDWFQNSVKASVANRRYCMDRAKKFRTYGPDSWGLTACDTPKGYSGLPGTPPSYIDNDVYNDGTVAPYGAIGSIVFTPEESLSAMEHYAADPRLWGRYGFLDAFNLDVEPAWYSDRVIGIDKGVSLLMLENYRSGLVWSAVMRSPIVQKGLEVMEIRPFPEGKTAK